jgi:hypothetical protein
MRHKAFNLTRLTDNLIKLDCLILKPIDQLNEASILAKELNLSWVYFLAARDTPDCVEDMFNVLASLILVDVLKLDVDTGLCLHVRESTGDGQTTLLGVEALDSLGNDPKARLDFVLMNELVSYHKWM